MPVSVRTHNPLTGPDAHRRIGDVVGELARQYAAIMNGSAFGTALRTRQLPRRRYLSLVATMYPIVVGFNRALIRSIAKVDHVRVIDESGEDYLYPKALFAPVRLTPPVRKALIATH